ncbi:MAG: HAD family hydrolase [Deltaproteobacteria bacterium]|nr:HAD family hydrolase [Deltaproteobacteria bacterium]
MSKIRCVVFDIDDTLYLERDYVKSGFNAVSHWIKDSLGRDGFSEYAFAAFERGVRGNTFNIVLKEMNIEVSEEQFQEMVRIYREHKPEIALLHDARECLSVITNRYSLAAVTDGPLESQKSKARALELACWFDPIIFTAELGQDFGKPHPRAFEIVERRTACRGAECVYVADNPEKDFQGPRSLGWRTVRIRRSHGLHVSKKASEAVEYEMEELARLPALLGEK